MLTSVVLPIYNGMPFLPEAIRSILAQEVELELVISDDCSNDGSLDEVYALADPRMTILENAANAGIFGNLNRCIRATNGEYIQIFSQDDVMKKGFLASQRMLLDKYPSAGFVYNSIETIDEIGNKVDWIGDDATPEVVDRDLYLWLAAHFGALPASISSVMVRRSTFEAVGLFDECFQVAGDLEFYNRVSEKFDIVRNSQPLHNVRAHTRMASALTSSGPRYLEEERALEPWFRASLGDRDFRRAQRYRCALRGRYHLGWIRRLALNGKMIDALRALPRLHRLYPLHWVVWWRLIAIARPGHRVVPAVPAPRSSTRQESERSRH